MFNIYLNYLLIGNKNYYSKTVNGVNKKVYDEISNNNKIMLILLICDYIYSTCKAMVQCLNLCW